MQKKIISLFLVLCMIVPVLPTVALAQGEKEVTRVSEENLATTYYDDADVTWLGTSGERQKALEGLYHNGLRKVAVGQNTVW